MEGSKQEVEKELERNIKMYDSIRDYRNLLELQWQEKDKSLAMVEESLEYKINKLEKQL